VSRKHLIGWLSLVTAICISVVAAFYSIIGLTKIFSASVVAVAIMATFLEIGKVVTATWLHENWHESPKLLRGYLTTAVAVLMFITSLGIFGFLSEAHSAKSLELEKSTTSISQLDDQIARRQSSIDRYESTLSQLDQSINQYLDASLITRGLQQRELQQDERTFLTTQISQNLVEIDSLQDIRGSLLLDVKSFEAEVSPILYFASVFGMEENLDSAVRIIIILLIFVFDPLAILMLVSANESLKRVYRANENKGERVHYVGLQTEPVNDNNANAALLKKKREAHEKAMMQKREQEQTPKKRRR